MALELGAGAPKENHGGDEQRNRRKGAGGGRGEKKGEGEKYADRRTWNCHDILVKPGLAG